jgi:hypothetical protein
MAERIEGIEIFAVGTWRGNKKIVIDSAALDTMLASYEQIGKIPGMVPPLVVGHGRDKGEMAYGWLDRLYRVGDKLLADFVDVPEYMIYLMKEKRYNSVSIEMYPTLDYNGKNYQNVLSAVAVLGAELPAVKGLKPLSECLFKASGDVEKLTKEEDAMFTQEQLNSLVAAAVAEANTKFKAEHDAIVTDLTAKITASEGTIKSANEGRETAEAALAVFKRESTDKELEAFVDGAIRDGRVLPKQKDKLIALAKSMSGVVKFADKEVSPLEALKEFISEGSKVDLSERGGGDPNAGGAKKAGDEVVRRAKAAQEKNDKLTFQLAVEKVLAEDPTLKQQYFAEA